MGRLRRFLQDTRGSATIEFVILFPFLFMTMMTGVELGVIQLRQTMMERAVEIVARTLKLGDGRLDSPEALKAAVCNITFVIRDCADNMRLEITPVQIESFGFSQGAADCIDRSGEVSPAVDMRPGSSNQIVMLRFCAQVDPLFGGIGLGRQLISQGNGGFPLVATTFFVNEPRNTGQ